MTYSELQNYAERQKLTVQIIADHIGMTRTGMKQSFENQTLPIKKVVELCNFLGISPNVFFGWKEQGVQTQIQHGCIGNIQNMNSYSDSIEILRSEIAAKNEQIKVKDEQLRSKDEQIARLLDLLNK